jgi:branched-chain amino acid aminotransferase
MTGNQPLPFDRRTGSIWLDGDVVDWADAQLHVLSHGLHYASSVFEGIRIYGGVPFMLAEHVSRLASSARILDFGLPCPERDLSAAALDITARSGIVDGYLRMNAWRGSEVIQTAALHTSVHVSVAAWEIPAGYYAAPDAADSGISLQTGRYRRPGPDSAPVKSKAAGNYMIGTVTKNEALRAGFDDALLLDCDGLIAEATGAHIFFVRAGVLHTPTTRCTIDGITRACVLGIAERLGIPAVSEDLPPDFVPTADAAFICGTATEVLPVARIDQYHLGRCGPEGRDLVRQVTDEYRALTAGRIAVSVPNVWAA